MAGLFRFHLFFSRKRKFIFCSLYFTAEKVKSIFGRPLIESVYSAIRQNLQKINSIIRRNGEDSA